MRRKLLLFVAVFIVAGKVFPQTPLWQWAVQAASSSNEWPHDMCTDASGNLYACGTFDGNLSIIFGSLFLNPLQEDGYIAKLSPSGALQWAIRIGGSGSDEIKGICLDASGNILVTGYFEGTADFDPQLFSTYNLTSAGGTDGFVAKYSSTGSLIWATRFGSTGDDEGIKIATDGSSSFISGYAQNGCVLYSTNSTTVAAPATEIGTNFTAARYNSSGVVQWAGGAGSSGADRGLDVCVDANRVYYIGNYSAGFAVYNASATAVTTLQAQTTNKTNVFVIAYNLDGSHAWSTNASSGDDDFGNSITQDGSNLYITGGFKNNTLNLPYPSPAYTIANQGGYDIFLASLQKSNGSYQWVSNQTGSGVSDEIAQVIHLSATGDLVIGGGFKGIISYSAVSGPSITSNGNDDIFISAFNTTGNFLWNTGAGGGNVDRAYALASTTTGAIYAAGEHANGVSFGTITLVNAAGKNIFVAKTGCETISNNIISGTQTVCATTSPATLTGSIPVPQSGTVSYIWQQSTNSVTWSPAAGVNTAQNYAPAPLAGSTFFRRIVLASGTCTYASNAATVTVHQSPSMASAGTTQTLCSTTATVFAIPPATGTGSWSVIAGSAALVSPASTTTGINNLSPGNNLFVWSVVNGVCPASTSSVSIYRDLPPAPAVAGPGQTICVSTATLSATAPTLGTGTWSVINGGSSVTSVANPSSQVNGITTGTNTFEWKVSNGVCPPSSATIQIIRDALPTPAVAGAAQTVCASTASITANVPGTGIGLWQSAAGGATITTPSTPTTFVGSLQNGVNTFTWTITNGVCPPSSSTTTVWRDQPPSLSVAGLSQSVCGTTATLAATPPSIGTGSWSVVNGNANFSSAANASAAVSALAPGVNVLMWTTTNGVCPNSQSTTTITAYLPPGTLTAGSNQTVCATVTTLSASIPGAGSGAWTTVAGNAIITSPSSATTGVTALDAGINKFAWTATNGVCAPSSATVQVLRITPPGTVSAGSDQTICVSSATLTATQPSVGSGQWSVGSATATIASPFSYSTTVNTLTPGTHQFVWSATNGICPVSTATVTITRDALPDQSLAAPDQTICAATSTLTANVPLTGTGQWVIVAGGASVAAPSSATSAVTGLGIGTNVFAWVISNGVCPSSSSTMSISRDEVPDASAAGSDQTVCAAASTITANSPTIGTGIWETAGGSAALTDPTNHVTGVTQLQDGSNQFVWKITNGVCPPSRDTLTIQKDEEPTVAVAGISQTLCAPQATLTNNKPLKGTGHWLSLGTGSVQPLNDTSALASGFPYGETQFVWTITNGVCLPSSDTTSVFSETPPSTADAGKDQHVCRDETELNATAPATGAGFWSVQSGAGLIAQNDSPLSQITGVTAGTTILVWTTTNGSCPQSFDTVHIIRDIQPVATILSTVAAICGDSLEVQGDPSQPGTIVWQLIDGTGAIVRPDHAVTVIDELSPGRVKVEYRINNGSCPAASDTLEFQVYHVPGPVSAGENTVVCSTEGLLSAVTPTAGEGRWSIVSGSGNIDNDQGPSSAVHGLPVGNTQFRWTVNNGICAAVSDEITIRRDSVVISAEAGRDQLTERFEVKLDARVLPGEEGTWEVLSGTASFSDPHDPLAVAAGLSTGANVLKWTIRKGICGISSDVVTIELKDFMIPNAITPNGDGKNDRFHITGLENYSPVKLTLYNSWGGIIYQDHDYRNTWEGQGTAGPVANDTYYYLLEIPGKSNYTGFITVKR